LKFSIAFQSASGQLFVLVSGCSAGCTLIWYFGRTVDPNKNGSMSNRSILADALISFVKENKINA
jgi:hypothetical protein